MLRSVLCSLLVAVCAAQFGRDRDMRDKPVCQCSTFDPCLAQEQQREEQCMFRTCPAQVFDQLHQDYMRCFADVPQNEQRLVDCVEQQIGKVCQGGNVRGKRQVPFQTGDGEGSGFDSLFQFVQNGLNQWKAFDDCMETCTNTTSATANNNNRLTFNEGDMSGDDGWGKDKKKKNGGPYMRCAKQLNCRLVKPTYDQVQTSVQTCSVSLNIDWRTQALTKCRCVEALGVSLVSCNTLETLMAQLDDDAVAEMASHWIAVMSGTGKW